MLGQGGAVPNPGAHLSLELDLARETGRLVPDDARISKLENHLAEQDPASVPFMQRLRQ